MISKKAKVHDFYQRPLDGEAIERASFATIDRQAGAHGFAPSEWEVVRRLIHASADLSLASQVRFSPDAISSGCAALRAGRRLIVDANMIRAGISLPRLKSVFADYQAIDVICAITDVDVAEQAHQAGLPRALFAVRKARRNLDGGLVLFGNSPVGLLEMNRLIIEEAVRPALVVGMPVGFVHVEESKEELMELPVPWIVVAGRRGGSPLALATLHALCTIEAQAAASDTAKTSSGPAEAHEAIILLGHGSRVPNAGDSMELVAEQLRIRHPKTQVEICFMSRLGPHFPETFERCLAVGARSLFVIPYFLHGGLHIRLDIPRMLQETSAYHPDVRIVYGERLGYDEVLVDVVEKRIRESRSAPDVRQLRLPPPEAFPVPPGQDEFVPMQPEQAERWRCENQKARQGAENNGQ
jgi:precorrin-8X/cobalt-precorrin-8 methylmutase